MTEFTERHEKIIEETHDTVIKISTVLLGVNGDKGLVGKVEESCKRIDKLESHSKTLVGILIGSGIFTGGTVAALVKLLG